MCVCVAENDRSSFTHSPTLALPSQSYIYRHLAKAFRLCENNLFFFVFAAARLINSASAVRRRPRHRNPFPPAPRPLRPGWLG